MLVVAQLRVEEGVIWCMVLLGSGHVLKVDPIGTSCRTWMWV